LIIVLTFKFKHFILELKCESFPGPGVDHIYNFNPMMEFINYGNHVDSAFEKFKHQHHKTYTNDSKEHYERKNYFRQNLR